MARAEGCEAPCQTQPVPALLAVPSAGALLQMPGLDLLPKTTVSSTLCQLVGSCPQATSDPSLGMEHNNDGPSASSLALAAPSTEHGRAGQPRPSPQSLLLPLFSPVAPMPKPVGVDAKPAGI